MNKHTKLWIFGDSWSALWPDYDPDRVWTKSLAQQLSTATSSPVLLRNSSLVGSAQDWAFSEYIKVIEDIQPEDYVVFILTSPSRYWYFEDIPTLSNWNILDFDTVVSPEQTKAVELYIKHIQRPQLDNLALIGRLGLMAYETKRRGLRRPLLIKGFEQELGPINYFEDLNIANGVLTHIQWNEYKDQELAYKLSDQGKPGYFNGADCRFNHMCLSNHDIFANKLLTGLINDTAPDLTTGFQTDLIAPDWYNDKEFCERELSPRSVEYFLEKVKDTKVSSWAQRTGILHIMDRITRTGN